MDIYIYIALLYNCELSTLFTDIYSIDTPAHYIYIPII